MTLTRPITLIIAAVLAGGGMHLSAEMVGPTQLPAARVIKNLTSRLTKNPKDAEAEYLLGRTHYTLFCFPNQGEKVYFYGTETQPKFPSIHPSTNESDSKANHSDASSISHALKALVHLRHANRLGGGEPGLYSLTLGCAYLAISPVASKVAKGATSASYRALALQQLVASFRSAKAKDLKREHSRVPLTWESWISVEAGESILRLAPNHPLKSEIRAHLDKMAKLPTGPITPLIFSLERPKALTDLLDSNCRVNFDLDGTGGRQSYSWVKPNTAFLVWQPDPRVPIRSGRQLFGNATWWLMNRNAYAAMRLLDDNSDGWLKAKELRGLGVWQDRNQNGIAEQKEVRSVGSVGIIGLRAKATGRVGESLVSAGGLKMKDGRLLPTYDWVTHNKGQTK